VSALLVQVINLFVVLVFYQLLKPVNKTMARLMVIFLLLGVSVLNVLRQVKSARIDRIGQTPQGHMEHR
jgi:uncharacterized protein (DUF486 family)